MFSIWYLFLCVLICHSYSQSEVLPSNHHQESLSDPELLDLFKGIQSIWSSAEVGSRNRLLAAVKAAAMKELPTSITRRVLESKFSESNEISASELEVNIQDQINTLEMDPGRPGGSVTASAVTGLIRFMDSSSSNHLLLDAVAL